MRQLPTYLETAGLPCFPKLPTYLTYHTGRRFRRAYLPTSELTRRPSAIDMSSELRLEATDEEFTH